MFFSCWPKCRLCTEVVDDLCSDLVHFEDALLHRLRFQARCAPLHGASLHYIHAHPSPATPSLCHPRPPPQPPSHAVQRAGLRQGSRTLGPRKGPVMACPRGSCSRESQGPCDFTHLCGRKPQINEQTRQTNKNSKTQTTVW